MNASPTSILLFDGVCHFCQGSVRFIVPRDRGGRFHFAALQSPVGRKLLRQYGAGVGVIDSVVLIEEGKSYVRSTAALRILKGLGGFWAILYLFILVPRPLRDWVYDRIAMNRYRIFGKDESCMVPTPDLMDRFLK